MVSVALCQFGSTALQATASVQGKNENHWVLSRDCMVGVWKCPIEIVEGVVGLHELCGNGSVHVFSKKGQGGNDQKGHFC